MSMSKHWCITLNNPVLEQDSFWNPAQMQYLIIANEIGESGTPHFQGYVIFLGRKRLSSVMKVFPGAHLEIKRGLVSEASDYCKKEKDFKEWGVRPADNSGAEATKRRWDEAFASAAKGNLDEIPKDMLVRYYHAFKRINQDNPPILTPLDTRHNYWVVGPTGYGKSTYARRRWPDFYDKAPNKWWTGYKGQSAVICDDFGPSQCQFLHWYMKRWADKFPFPAEEKGGGKTIRPKNIIVTSQYTIEECFISDQKVIDAINNRFEVINLPHYGMRIDPLLNVD